MILDIGRGLLSMLFGLLVSPLGIPLLVLSGLAGIPTIPLVLLGLVCLLTVPLAVLFRRPAGISKIEDTGEGGGQIVIDRSALPRWLWWLQTPDERLPGGLYEPTILKWLSAYGDYGCSVRWLWRNAGYGFAWALGRPADGYLDAVDGLIYRAPIWRWKRVYGPIALQCGWKIHRANFAATPQAGPFRAIPFVSIRLKGNS